MRIAQRVQKAIERTEANARRRAHRRARPIQQPWRSMRTVRQQKSQIAAARKAKTHKDVVGQLCRSGQEARSGMPVKQPGFSASRSAANVRH